MRDRLSGLTVTVAIVAGAISAAISLPAARSLALAQLKAALSVVAPD